jgi:hypothetical protein
MGVTSSEVKATGMAEARDANATDCLKPLAIPDRWTERQPVAGPWGPTSTFDKWDPANVNVLLAPPDTYYPPTGLATGSGLTVAADFGREVVISPGAIATPVSPISPWKYLPIHIPGSAFGTNMLSNTTQCARSVVTIDDSLDIETGSVSATIANGMTTLIARDPAATWDVAKGRVENSCADAPTPCASWSPRIIALPLYDAGALADASKFALPTQVVVKNFVGFFIESVAGNNITGRLTRHPGLIRNDALIVIDASTFLRAALLVQ